MGDCIRIKAAGKKTNRIERPDCSVNNNPNCLWVHDCLCPISSTNNIAKVFCIVFNLETFVPGKV